MAAIHLILCDTCGTIIQSGIYSEVYKVPRDICPGCRHQRFSRQQHPNVAAFLAMAQAIREHFQR